MNVRLTRSIINWVTRAFSLGEEYSLNPKIVILEPELKDIALTMSLKSINVSYVDNSWGVVLNYQSKSEVAFSLSKPDIATTMPSLMEIEVQDIYVV